MKKNVYGCIPTGCGKTVIILQYHCHHPTEILLVLVPRIILMEQWGEECEKVGIKPYLIGTGRHHNMDQYIDETIVICVYDSFATIYYQNDSFDSYCIDEAHHIKTPERYMDTELEHEIQYHSDNDSDEEETLSYMECIQSLSDTNRAIYLSATLDKPDDTSLFYEYKVRQAIEEGYLCDYQFVFPIFEKENIANEHLAYYLVHKQHESHCVIYASSCKEGQEFTTLLNQLRKGCAGYIDAYTSYKERQQLFAEFESGQIQFLVNIRILVEGFNAPHIRSIFFLRVSASEIFIIQAIGRALRKHQDKLVATIYVPFTQESDLERIQTFISQVSTYDERVKQSIDKKTVGGYVNIEHGVDEEDGEDGEDVADVADVFQFRYNLIVDRMGKSNTLEELAVKKALMFKAFYEIHQRKPIRVLAHKSNKKQNASDEQTSEHRLAMWLDNMKSSKNGKCKMIIYPSVENILIKILGETWYENKDLEGIALKKALLFKEFYQINHRKPSQVLTRTSKEQKQNASDEQKQEHSLAVWFDGLKISKKGKGTMVLYPSVEKIIIELLGDSWYENKDMEEDALRKALLFKEFYKTKNRKPSLILGYKEKKQNATDKQKEEHQLATWFDNIRKTIHMKSNVVLYPSVEKILIELLGETWHKNKDLEGDALRNALLFKEFYQTNNQKPCRVLRLKSTEQKQNASQKQKQEQHIATWFNNMKLSKKGKNNSVLYLSVEKILIELLGNSWFI
jgi:superfamily II DNA or RNA helicase